MSPDSATSDRRLPAGAGGDDRAGTLTVTDNRTGEQLRAADHRRHRAGDGPEADQDRRARLRPDGLRPGLHEHRLLPQRDHLHRRRRRDPPAPRLPDRAAVRALQLPRGRLPADQRRAADRARSWRRWVARDHDPHVRARERQGLHAGLPLRRQPDGHARGLRRRAVDLLPGRQQHPRRGRARDPDHPAARQDADAGGVRVPPQHGPALRLPRQRPQLRGQLPGDDVQDDRAQIRARSSPRARAGRALHPARRPRTERLDERRALGRLDAGRPLLGGRRRGRRAVRAAARRRQRGGAADARADRQRWRTSPTSWRA